MNPAALLLLGSLLAFSSIASVQSIAAPVCFVDYVTHFGVTEVCKKTGVGDRPLSSRRWRDLEGDE